MDVNEDLDVSGGVSLANHADGIAGAGPAGEALPEATERGVDAEEDGRADAAGAGREEAVSTDAAADGAGNDLAAAVDAAVPPDDAEDGQAVSLTDHRKRCIASVGVVLCVVAAIAGFDAWGGWPLRMPWDNAPHYVVSRIDTPDVLLAADGSTAPADVWRKNRHGAPYKRTIDVQLQFDAGCTPSETTVHAHKTGSRWMDLDLEFEPVEGKTCDGEKTEWTWWRVSVDGAGDDWPSQTDYESVLPLDDVTSVTASWDGWPGGKKGPLPQWRTQMDELD